MQHAEAQHEHESEDDLRGHQPEEDDGQMMEFDHGTHSGSPDGVGQEGDDLELRNVSTVNDVGAELGLNALRDSPEGVKPFYPYSTLIRTCISVGASRHSAPSIS